MTGAKPLDPNPSEFDAFIYAPVGKDRNGYSVTVLSTLARLNLDPWVEAAELVKIGDDAARIRIELLLARSWDAPALAKDRQKVARKLSLLLPQNSPSHSIERAAALMAGSNSVFFGLIWTIPMLVFVIIRMVFFNSSGSGE